jgi:cell wall-associated NlpC family hydrolase
MISPLPRIVIATILMLPMILTSCSEDKTQENLDATLAATKAKLAPDTRVTVFNVKGAVESGKIVLSGDVYDLAMKEAVVRNIREKNHLPVEDRIRTLPDPGLGAMLNGVVSVSVANIRTAPAHAAELITQAILGTPVRFLKKKEGWTYVQTPDGYLGWTDDNIRRYAASDYAGWLAAPKVIVTARSAWVRSTPDKKSEPVSDVVAGSLLAHLGDEHGSMLVKFPDSREGYLDYDEAAPFAAWLASTKASEQSVIRWAQSLMGVPYLWGGTSTKAMDCSGFVRTVYFMNGIYLPRDASQQYLVGDPVAMNNGNADLRPGDLLFFGMTDIAGKLPKVSHVGISLGGPRYIHESGLVQVSSLDPDDPGYSEVRAQSFLGARRIIGAMESSGIKHLSSLSEYH